MKPSGIVTLLTDFGQHDPFVGVMKGVLLGRYREVELVDLCHEIEPQQIAEACYWIERSFRWFPAGTTHVVVVDPGVGSARAALVVRAAGHYFVAPDNGVLTRVLAAEPGAETRCIEIARHGLPQPSATFHGRDVFAPIAAELCSARLAFEAVGPRLAPTTLSLPEPRAESSDWVGEVVAVDRFGNLLTNLGREHAIGSVQIADLSLPIVESYSEAAPLGYVALINAWDNLEIARRDGSAARGLGIGRGAAVRVRRAPG